MKKLIILSLIIISGFTFVHAQGSADKPKSVKYILYSLAIPGLGEYQMGEKNYLTYFLTTEAILLVGAYSLDYYSVSLLNNALNYAENKAGYSGKEKSREFILAMGSHNSLSDYNIAMRQQRNLNAVFPENDPNFHWEWQNQTQRETYRDKRRKSDLIGYSVPFVIGAVFINHAVSAFNVLRIQRSDPKTSSTQPEGSGEYTLWASPVDPVIGTWGNGIQLNYRYQF
ncbi:MAG: hypothetical protein LCH54_14450 [Bacteroidetes bacterium]|nr:hypothetical protein [Bacteroidota bacterium]